MKHLSAFWRDLSLLIVWLGIIFSWSTSAGSSTHTNSWIDALLSRLLPHWYAGLTWPEQDALHYYVRKAAHVTEYAILGILTVRVLRHRQRWGRLLLLGAWGFATFYAATDETHQIFVAGRTAKVTDVLLDSAGAALGIGLYALIRARRAGRAGNSLPTVEG